MFSFALDSESSVGITGLEWSLTKPAKISEGGEKRGIRVVGFGLSTNIYAFTHNLFTGVTLSSNHRAQVKALV